MAHSVGGDMSLEIPSDKVGIVGMPVKQSLHSDLVALAVRWLLRSGRCSIAFSEFATCGMETPDAIGFSAWASTIIECKVSRSDFLADGRKPFRQHPELGMGQLRYYLTAGHLIDGWELPQKWGLLELHGRKVRMVRKPEGFSLRNRHREISYLVSMLRRAKVRLPANGIDPLNRWLKIENANIKKENHD
jgi:hypothetical protein